MIKFIDIEFGSTRYKELLDLRYKILLQPLGLKFLDSYREEEATFLHIGCIESSTDELIGGLILVPVDDEEIRDEDCDFEDCDNETVDDDEYEDDEGNNL